MKVALTGDTHEGYGGLTAQIDWDWFWYEIAKKKPDLLIHVGDWGMAWEDVRYAMERMRKLIHCPVIGTLGNHDHWTYPMEPDHEMLQGCHGVAADEQVVIMGNVGHPTQQGREL